jgi:hypothetical protein
LAPEKKDTSEKVKSPTPKAPSEDLDFIIRHALGKKLSEEEIAEAKHYTRELKYTKGALLYNGTNEDDFLYYLPDNKEISVCREIAKNIGFPKLEVGLSALSKDDLADSLVYNSLKVRKLRTYKQIIFCLFFCADPLPPLFLQGLILSNALRGQKNAEDESCQIALSNLRSEVIKLRNEGAEKDKILLSLVHRVKASEANLAAQSEAHKAEIEDLKKKLAEKNEDFEMAKAKPEISEWTSARLQKNVDELRELKERYYEKSLDCAKKLKDSFAKVCAYSTEQKFIRGDPEGIIDWIREEVEAFEEILSDRGDICAFSGTRGVATILEKAGCEHVKVAAQAEAVFFHRRHEGPFG